MANGFEPDVDLNRTRSKPALSTKMGRFTRIPVFKCTCLQHEPAGKQADEWNVPIYVKFF